MNQPNINNNLFSKRGLTNTSAVRQPKKDADKGIKIKIMRKSFGNQPVADSVSQSIHHQSRHSRIFQAGKQACTAQNLEAHELFIIHNSWQLFSPE